MGSERIERMRWDLDYPVSSEEPDEILERYGVIWRHNRLAGMDTS